MSIPQVINSERHIALMLGRLRMPTSECIDAYREINEKMFGWPQSHAHQEKFSPEALERAVKDIVKRKLGDENAPLMHLTCCKT